MNKRIADNSGSQSSEPTAIAAHGTCDRCRSADAQVRNVATNMGGNDTTNGHKCDGFSPCGRCISRYALCTRGFGWKPEDVVPLRSREQYDEGENTNLLGLDQGRPWFAPSVASVEQTLGIQVRYSFGVPISLSMCITTTQDGPDFWGEFCGKDMPSDPLVTSDRSASLASSTLLSLDCRSGQSLLR